MKQSRISIAEHYHRETKYTEAGLNNTPAVDFTQQPAPFKEYLSERALDLTSFLPLKKFPLTGARNKAVKPAVERDSVLGRLSRVLYFTYGVTGIVQSPGNAHLFRAAPSAGALYPIELYLATQGVPGIENGIHNFLVRLQQLVPVFDGDFLSELERIAFGHPAFRHAQAVVLVTANYQRSAWRYRERCYRRILLDAGHVVGNLALAAVHEGMLAVPCAGFLDDDANQLLFLDSQEESVMLLAPLVPAEVLERPVDLSAPVRRSAPAPCEVSADEALYSAFHRGSSVRADLPVARQPPRRDAVPLAGEPVPLREHLVDLGPSLPTTIIRRRSTRRFTGNDLEFGALAKILDFAERATARQPAPILHVPEWIETFVIVHGIAGLVPGIYRHRPDEHDLVPVRAGSFRHEACHFCLGQELGRDAAAIIVHAAHLPRALERFGERAYRYLHMDAGVLGQYMNLAAIHLGKGASGIGGFYDDEINELLGVAPEYCILYVTVLGDPASAE